MKGKYHGAEIKNRRNFKSTGAVIKFYKESAELIWFVHKGHWQAVWCGVVRHRERNIEYSVDPEESTTEYSIPVSGRYGDSEDFLQKSDLLRLSKSIIFPLSQPRRSEVHLDSTTVKLRSLNLRMVPLK
jgi:hypothetical protein